MNKGVIYMCFGTKHNAHQCVSFHSMRKHWQGEVAIICDEANMPNMQRFVEQDPAGKTQLVKFDPHTRRKHGSGAGYLNKTHLIELSPFVHSVFLDCDTCVVGEFEKAFPDDVEVRITQFSDWVTTGSKMRKRISGWREAMPDAVGLQLAIAYPAINTGVMGLSKLSKGLSKRWHEVCAKNVSFMCDELAMQLIFLERPHVVLPDYYNCSPVFSPDREGFELERVRIWHGHGFKSIRHHYGLSIWLPELIELWGQNLYGVNEAFAENKYFKRLAADPIEFIRKYGGDRGDELIETNDIHEWTFK